MESIKTQTPVKIEYLQFILTKMNEFGVSEMYIGNTQKNMCVFLMPCEKAKTLVNRFHVEELIKSIEKNQLNTK